MSTTIWCFVGILVLFILQVFSSNTDIDKCLDESEKTFLDRLMDDDDD